MTLLILIRHGETEGNVQQVWHGALDAPLTVRGQLQVAATARYVAQLVQQYPLDAFYVSPLARAQSTAAAIAQAIDHQPLIEPVIESDLREFDLGDWEGRSFADLKAQENLWGRWQADPGFAPPNGESPRSFHRRAVAVMQKLVATHPEQTLLMVTHGALLSNVLATWFGSGAEDWRRFEPHNCAISIVEQNNGHWLARQLNSVAHLPAEALSPTAITNYE